MPKQKFIKGDLVKISADLGPSMAHFQKDCKAIVMGSYKDQFGGDDTKSYTLLINGSETSWYEEHQLKLIRHVGLAGIKAARKKREKENKKQSDLDWIIKNWPRLREKTPGATAEKLMALCGIKDPWGPRGEGYVWDMNARKAIWIINSYYTYCGPEKTLSELKIEERKFKL